MTEKEKAQEIFDKMMQTISDDCEHSGYCTKRECNYKGMIVCKVNINEAKQCALICVDEIIDALNSFGYSGVMYDDFGTGQITFTDEIPPDKFWQKVKEAILKQ